MLPDRCRIQRHRSKASLRTLPDALRQLVEAQLERLSLGSMGLIPLSISCWIAGSSGNTRWIYTRPCRRRFGSLV